MIGKNSNLLPEPLKDPHLRTALSWYENDLNFRIIFRFIDVSNVMDVSLCIPMKTHRALVLA